MRLVPALALLFALPLTLQSQAAPAVAPTQVGPPPGPPPNVFHEDITWNEMRDAIRMGYTTYIIPTGGVEQNGPHMVLGKHNFIVNYAAERIAKALGNTIVGPVLMYVPEGTWEPKSSHMRFPGTLGLDEAGFQT